jgi:excisionase family DNA binding protein
MQKSNQCRELIGSKESTPMDKSQFISRMRAAQILDCSPQTIDKFIRSGRLRAYHVGRKVVVRLDELIRQVEANEIR